MFVNFTVACHRIYEELIPALLEIHHVRAIHDLPSPLKGELLFLKGLIHYLTRSPNSERPPIFLLVAAVSLFNHCFPSVNTKWWHFLSDPNQKTNYFLEEQMLDHLIGFMLQLVLIKPGQVNLFRNADEHFDGTLIFARALVRQSELLRLQLMHSCAESPHFQEIKQDGHPSTFKHSLPLDLLDRGMMPSLQHNIMPTLSYQLNDILCFLTEIRTQNVVHLVFLKRALQQIEMHYPSGLKHWMIAGLLLLMSARLQQHPLFTEEEVEFKEKLIQLIRRLGFENTPLVNWIMSDAAFWFCKSILFKEGRAEKGLMLEPLLGLPETEIWQYWQKAIFLRETSYQLLLTTQLKQVAHLPQAVGRYGFYSPSSSVMEEKEIVLVNSP